MKTYEATERAYRNGYEKGLEDGKPKWIPVTERLPDESIPSQHYLCWYKGRVRILKYWRTRKRFESNGRVANVTHWMPLPEPPKEGAEDG